MGRDLGPLLVQLGASLVLVGLVAWAGGLAWFGRLPGDIHIERQNVRLYVPITSMLAISIAISIIVSVFRR